MVQINFAQKQVNAKIVYYGPGMSGKTTNLEIVYQRAPQPNRGELTSISTDGDRTLFFDFMPLDLGTVSGMRTCFQIYTVPGQVYYNSTRKLVLQGCDGVVFVADSSAAMLEENLESMRNLEQNLNEYGKSLSSVPLVVQYNKRDLPDAMSVEELNRHLNPYGAPYFEAIANSGQGVFPTLKALAARVLDSIHAGGKGTGQSVPGAVPVSTGMTGFYQAPARGPGSAPAAPPPPAAPIHAAPSSPPAVSTSGQPASRPFHQTGFHTRPDLPPRTIPLPTATAAAQLQPLHPSGAPIATGQVPSLGVSGPIDPLARTAIHAPPAGMPMQPSAYSTIPGVQAGGYPAAQQPAQWGQPGTGPALATPGAQPGAQPAAPVRLMKVEAQAQAAPARAPQKRAMPPARAGGRSEPAPRIQPRGTPRATPGNGSKKKNVVYTTVFITAALGVGAVLAKMFLSFL